MVCFTLSSWGRNAQEPSVKETRVGALKGMTKEIVEKQVPG
jgi:hypothetical protein